MTESNNAVFLSYAAQDAAAAQRLCATLRAAGIEVWFDQSELRGGDAWDQKIRREIRDCALFIPIISANTQARLEGYFRREWKLAVARTHGMADDKPFLVPVVIDGTRDQDARVPEQFHAVQWTYIPTGEISTAFVERVQYLLAQDIDLESTPIRSASGASIPERSIAVLPFTNHARTPELDTLARCIAEDLASQLARTPGFQVVAQPAVGAPHALYVISGSVRQHESGRVRVAIQIIEGESAQYVWTMQQDLAAPCASEDVDDFVARTSAKIEQQLTLVEAGKERHKGTAHDAWSKVRQANSALFSAGWSEEAVASAVCLFREAIALDPKFALARAQKALIMALASQWGLLPGDDLREEARADAENALELEPTKSAVLGYAGCALADLGDTERALPLLERAIEENPNNAQAWAALGAARLLRRQYEPAVEALRRGLRISPTDYRRSVWLTALAGALARTGKLDQALAAAQDACRADAKFYPAQIVRALVLTKLDKGADAVKALTEARRIRPRLALGEIQFWAGQVLDGAAASLDL
ncbi:MAG: TIR domain-containing protein [Steroidobacteraceae bacterium]